MESHFSIFVSLEKVSSSLIGLISKQESETKAWNKSGQSKECFVLSLVYLPGKEALIPPSYLPLELFNNHHDFALIRSFKRKTLQEEDQDKKIGRKSTPQPKNCARRWRCRTSLIGMRTLSARLTLRPKIAFNNNKMHLKYSKLLLSDLPKNKVSPAKGKWEVNILSDQTLVMWKPFRKPMSTALFTTLLSVSITKINKKRRQWITLTQPCGTKGKPQSFTINQYRIANRRYTKMHSTPPLPWEAHFFKCSHEKTSGACGFILIVQEHLINWKVVHFWKH